MRQRGHALSLHILLRLRILKPNIPSSSFILSLDVACSRPPPSSQRSPLSPSFPTFLVYVVPCRIYCLLLVWGTRGFTVGNGDFRYQIPLCVYMYYMVIAVSGSRLDVNGVWLCQSYCLRYGHLTSRKNRNFPCPLLFLFAPALTECLISWVTRSAVPRRDRLRHYIYVVPPASLCSLQSVVESKLWIK